MKIYKSPCPEISFKYKSGTIKKVKFTCSQDAADYFRLMFDEDTLEYFESFFVVYLNRALNTIAWIKISQGGMAGTVADPKMIMKAALDTGASNIMLAHNHPSGNARPSDSDILLTRKIKDGSKFFDIKLLDHIILTGKSEYFSFADEGLL